MPLVDILNCDDSRMYQDCIPAIKMAVDTKANEKGCYLLSQVPGNKTRNRYQCDEKEHLSLHLFQSAGHNVSGSENDVSCTYPSCEESE